MDERDTSGRRSDGSRRLTLELALPRAVRAEDDLVVHVVVEDIGEADGRATVLFETELPAPEVRPDGSFGPLHIDIPDIPDAIEPAIRVHVDLGATGTVTVGDFVNPSIVRLPEGPDPVSAVPLTEVREGSAADPESQKG